MRGIFHRREHESAEVTQSLIINSRMKTVIILIVLLVVLNSCSTKAYLPNPVNLANKRIAVGIIDVGREQKGKTIYNDTVCACIAKTVGETLYPYLQKKGAVIVTIPYEEKTSETRVYTIADSLQVDYLLTGTGHVNRTGKTDFMHQLNIKLVSVRSKEVVLTGSFSGPGVYPAGAAERVGKKMLRQ